MVFVPIVQVEQISLLDVWASCLVCPVNGLALDFLLGFSRNAFQDLSESIFEEVGQFGNRNYATSFQIFGSGKGDILLFS